MSTHWPQDTLELGRDDMIGIVSLRQTDPQYVYGPGLGPYTVCECNQRMKTCIDSIAIKALNIFDDLTHAFRN